MKIALVGWGIETKSAFSYYGPNNDYLIVSEEPRDDFPHGDNIKIRTLTDARKPGLTGNVTDYSYLHGLEEFGLVVYSPSAHKNLEKIYPENSIFWKKATTILEEFFKHIKTKNIVGVTGTKGKGTTTTLIAELLKAMGKNVHIGGNIGIPVLDLLPDIGVDDWVVLELSSFQLYKLDYSPHIAVHLMMVPEHIDEWHKSIEDYVSSKRNIFAHQSSTDIAVYNPQNKYSSQNVLTSPGAHIPYLEKPGAVIENGFVCIDGEKIIATYEVGLLGTHNLENICAAITAVWQVEKDPIALREVVKNFKGLEHRLQMVREVNDIKYYDDSFGTTPDTAIVAMDAIRQPKIMIVGGHDKGNDYSEMINRLGGEDIRAVICLGPTGKYIAEQLAKNENPQREVVSKSDFNNWSMQEILETANKLALPNDAVLLSTGSASFGIFSDYKDRGNQFISCVNSL